MNIIGHSLVTKYISEGLEQRRLSPSLFFVGPDGVGKRTVALELAKVFCCKEIAVFSSGCVCAGCARVNSLSHSDLLVVNDAFQASLLKEKPESQLSVKIESIRHLDKFLRIRPLEARRRIAIIEDADAMTVEAANALLKILEEPPVNTQIILLAKESRNVPSTILSRCALLRFRPIPEKDIVLWLHNVHGVGFDEAEEAARRSNGSLGLAFHVLNQADEKFDIASFSIDEFFNWLDDPTWKREPRKKAETLLLHLTVQAQRALEKGDFSKTHTLDHLFRARRQLDRHVPARLVLENLYLKLEKT